MAWKLLGKQFDSRFLRYVDNLIEAEELKRTRPHTYSVAEGDRKLKRLDSCLNNDRQMIHVRKFEEK